MTHLKQRVKKERKKERKYCHKSIDVTMKVPIYKVSCIVIGSKCAVMRSTSQLVDVAALCAKLRSLLVQG